MLLKYGARKVFFLPFFLEKKYTDSVRSRPSGPTLVPGVYHFICCRKVKFNSSLSFSWAVFLFYLLNFQVNNAPYFCSSCMSTVVVNTGYANLASGNQRDILG